MAIESITAGVYNDAARIQTTTGHSAGTPVKQSQAGTPAAAAIYKEKETDSFPGDASGKSGDDAARQIRATIAEANFKATRTRCEYSLDDKTNRISIKMIDEETNEVIKEIPPEKSLEMLAKVWELAGILVDEKR